MNCFVSSAVPVALDIDEPEDEETSTTNNDSPASEFFVGSLRPRNKRIIRRKIDLADDESSLDPSSIRRTSPSRKKSRTKTATTRSDDGGSNNGWLTKSLLKAVAQRFKGTASQFRVVYSEYEIKDSTTKTMIPPHTLCVQSRSVSAAGHSGGQTWAFMTWRLPGKKVNRNSIYTDTRPRFYSRDAAANAYPIIVLDDTLHPMAKMLISTFLDEAQAGTSPMQFYHNTECSNEAFCVLSRAPDYAFNGGSNSEPNHQASIPGSDSNKKLQEEQEEEESQDGGCNALDDHGTPLLSGNIASIKYVKIAAAKNIKIRTDSEDASSIDATDAPRAQANSSKRPLPFWWSTQSTKKKRKVYGGSNKKPLPVSTRFRVNDRTGDKQFLVLIEGLIERQKDSTVLTASQHGDQLRDIFMDPCTESVPRKGRLVELLPTEALSGDWSANLVGPDGFATHVPGLLRNNGRDLQGIRICLRHEEFHELGLLSEARSMKVAGLAGAVCPTRQVHVSVIDPSISRTKDFDRQGGLSETDEPPVVVSISIAVCEGCTSFADASSTLAGQIASKILESVRDGVVAECEEGEMPSIGLLEKLLPIPSEHYAGSDDSEALNLGVSFLCKLGVKESYKVLVAQDEQGRTVAADVVLGPSSRFSTSSASTCSVSQRPQLTAANIQRLGVEIQDIALSIRQGSIIDEEEEEACSAIDSDGRKSSNGSSDNFAGGMFDEPCQHTDAALKSDHIQRPTAITPAGQQGALNGRSSLVASSPTEDCRPFDISTNPKCTSLATESETDGIVGFGIPAAVTPAVPRTEMDAQKESLLSPTMMPRATLPYVTPQVGRGEHDIDRASKQEFADAWDSDSSQFGELDTIDSHHGGPPARTTHHTSIDEEARGDVEDQAPMKEGRPGDKASSFRNLYAHNHSWGTMGLAFFIVVMLTQLEVSSRLPETLRSESRFTMTAVGNSSFHELLSQTEEVLSARRGFSIIGGEWVSTVAIVLVAFTFGGT